MIFERKSMLSGIIRSKDIPVTQEQLNNWNNGMLIQEAMPNISSEDREFIMTGVTSEEWDTEFKDE